MSRRRDRRLRDTHERHVAEREAAERESDIKLNVRLIQAGKPPVGGMKWVAGGALEVQDYNGVRAAAMKRVEASNVVFVAVTDPKPVRRTGPSYLAAELRSNPEAILDFTQYSVDDAGQLVYKDPEHRYIRPHYMNSPEEKTRMIHGIYVVRDEKIIEKFIAQEPEQAAKLATVIEHENAGKEAPGEHSRRVLGEEGRRYTQSGIPIVQSSSNVEGRG